MINYRIKIDCQASKVQMSDMEFVTGDVRAYRLEFSFYDNGQLMDLTDKTFTVKGKRADGVVLSDAGEISGNTAVLVPKNELFSVAGELYLEIVLTDAFNSYATTKILIANVIEGMGTPKKEATESVSVYTKLINIMSARISETESLLRETQRVQRGYSAYEIAVQNGFSGTEEDWLASLQGTSGVAPEKGIDYWTPEDKAEIQSYIDTQLGVIENGSY